MISGLFAALAAVCAFFAFHSWRRCVASYRELEALAASLRSSRSKIAEIESAVDGLHDQFHKLRGKFYASQRKSPANGEDSQEDTQTSTPAAAIAGPIVDSVAWKAKMRGQYLKPSK